jgi:hypothetical protein
LELDILDLGEWIPVFASTKVLGVLHSRGPYQPISLLV